VKYLVVITLCFVAIATGGCNILSNRSLAKASVNYQQGTVLDPSFMQSLRNGG